MKPLLGAALLSLAIPLCAAVDKAPQIYMEEMSEEKPHEVPTFPRVGTSLIFPAPIEKWIGSGFTYTPDKQQGDYQVEWKAGDTLLTLSPVMEPSFRSTPLEERIPRNMNIFCQGKLIVVEVVMAPSRAEAASSIKFVEQLPEGYSRTRKAKEATNDEPKPEVVTEVVVPQATPSQSLTAWAIAVSNKQSAPSAPTSESHKEGNTDTTTQEPIIEKANVSASPSPTPSASPTPTSADASKPVTVVETVNASPSPSPTSSSALLDLIHASATLEGEELANALQGLPALDCSTRELSARDAADYGAFSIKIIRLIQDNRSKDVGLVFSIENKTTNVLAVEQGSLVVRIGDTFFPQPLVALPAALTNRATFNGVVMLNGLTDTDISQPIRASIEARRGNTPNEKKRVAKKEGTPRR